MKHGVGIIIIALALISTFVGLAGCSKSVAHAIYMDYEGVNAAVSKSTHGLSLTLALNAKAYQPGSEISIIVDEQNTLSTENRVRISYDWRLNGLVTSTFCNTNNYPFGVAVYAGDYPSDKLAKLKPVYISDPRIMYHCIAGPTNYFTYIFKPLSNIIWLRADGAELSPMKDEIKIHGYWTQSCEFGNFEPGVYTVAAGDEWGTLAVVHFTVTE